MDRARTMGEIEEMLDAPRARRERQARALVIARELFATKCKLTDYEASGRSDHRLAVALRERRDHLERNLREVGC